MATPSPTLSARRVGPRARSAAVTALVTLLAALLGFVLLVVHDAMSRAATQQTQGLQRVALLWEADADCVADGGASCPPADATTQAPAALPALR